MTFENDKVTVWWFSFRLSPSPACSGGSVVGNCWPLPRPSKLRTRRRVLELRCTRRKHIRHFENAVFSHFARYAYGICLCPFIFFDVSVYPDGCFVYPHVLFFFFPVVVLFILSFLCSFPRRSFVYSFVPFPDVVLFILMFFCSFPRHFV